MQYVLHCINNDSFNKYLCLPLSVCTAKICIFKQYLKCVEHPLLIGLGVQNFACMVPLGSRTNLGGAPTHSLNLIFLDHPNIQSNTFVSDSTASFITQIIMTPRVTNRSNIKSNSTLCPHGLKTFQELADWSRYINLLRP